MVRSRTGFAGAVAALVALVTLVVPVGAASADAALVLRGGATSVTASPAVTSTLVRNGILPLPAGGASEVPVVLPGGIGVKATFPVNGGSVDAATLAGTVTHSGGLVFVNLARWKAVTVSDFTIVIDGSPHLVATKVNGSPASLRVFDLDLSGAKVATTSRGVVVSGIRVSFTGDAAMALNSSLGTKVFTAGLVAGSADTRLVPAT